MSTKFISMFMLLLLLLLNPQSCNTRGCSTTPFCAARPLEKQNGPNYMKLKPDEKGHGFHHSGSVEACLPKGFRRTSAPSRYINYQPLGSTCSDSGKVVNGPWPLSNDYGVRVAKNALLNNMHNHKRVYAYVYNVYSHVEVYYNIGSKISSIGIWTSSNN